MGQIASAPCGAGFGPSTTCSAVSWEDVDVDDLQTQPIDIRHFLQRAEDEAKFWQEPQAAHVQPIRLLTPADRFLKHSTQKMKPRPSSNQDLDPTVVLSPDEACSMLPMLMDDRWIAPLVALLGGKDLKVVEMALAALSQLVDSEARQEMVIKSQGLSKLVHVVAFAHFQQIAFEALTAVCNGNGKACLDVASLGIIDTIFDVCKLKLSNADERKCSALQTLLVLVKHPEIKNTVAVSARVTVLVEFISCPNAPIAFYALSCLSELFACDSARKTAISSNVLTTLLRLLESPATANKTILLQTIYALSILATHESESFPIGESVGAISNAMDILRGALKRSRLASLVCMLVTGLAWKQPGTNKFQRALRERTSPNLFAILASLLIGGSTDVLCTAAIAVGALCHSCLENALAFAKLDVHTILAKLLPHKDDRVVSCAAMALSRFLTAFEMRAKAADLLWEPWQQEIAQSIAECTSIEGSPLDILYTSVIADRPEGNIASAFEIQTALDLFGFSGGKGRWTNATAVRAMLSLLSLSAGDLRLELLLFFQSCTEPIGGDIEPMDFCNLILNHDGLSLFVSLLQDATHLSHVCVVLRILLNLVFVYYKTPMPQPQPQFESMLRQIVRLVARTDVLDVHRAAIKLLEVATETKFCQAVVALNTLITADPNCIANLLFSQCQAVQRTSGIVISRLVRQFQGQWIPLSSVLVQLTSLLHSPSDDVAFAASHAWGSLLERIELCQTFSSIPDGVTFLLDQLETNRRAKYLIDAGRTLNRAAKHPAIQSQLLGHGFSVLERLIVHQLDALAHYAMLTLCQVGQNEALRPAIVSPSLIHQLNVFLTKSPDEDVNFTEPRRVSNAMDALCWIAEVCLDATTQQTALHAGLVDKVVACVLEKGPMHDVKLCAFSAIATLCSCDPTTREHILSEAVADAVLRQLDVQDDDASQDNEALVLLCLKILLQLLAAPSAQTIIAKSPRMGNIVQTLRFSSDKIRSLACQVIAVLSLRCDSVKADMCRLDINNILLNIVFAESNETKRINPSSRVQRHALHALSVLCEGVSPASKTNKQEIFDLPSATKLTDDMLSLPESEDAVESTALLCAVLANATYYSPRNQRLVFERQTEAKFIDLIMTSSTQRKSSYSEMLAIECMRALANLAAYPDNRKVMAQDNVFFNALHLALQSDVPQLHRFAALTIAQLCTGNDSHKVAMGAFNGLLPSLAERLGSKHPHVLENVCFAITKLGTYGGNKIIFGANLIFERLLPLVLHAEVAIQRMAMTAIAVLIEGNDRNKAALVECNAIPILCSLCQAHVNNRILEGAFQTLAELVSTQIVEVSKYINPAMLVQMLGSVNTRLFKAALQLLAHLTKESFNKVRFGEKACIEAVLRNLHAPQISNIPNDNRDEEENRSLLDSESDLATIELAATALANLSFEPANTSTIVETETEMSLIARLGEIMESAMVVAQELQRSPAKKKLSPIKKSSNQEDRVVVPLLASRPMQCQHILEQCSLILNNCAQEIQKHSLVTETIVSIVCRLLKHPSDLVKKCACFTLTSWCSKSPQHQEWVMDAEQNVLGTLIGMLNSSSPGILEATLWLLTKLSNYSDNYVKMAANDIVRILESTIFRFHTTIGSGVLDRAIRLLGNLALHDGVRKTIRGEALVAGPLSSILDHEKQLHETTSAASHAKNTARLISILLADDALKLFFPKKTISLLQTLYVVPTAQVKVRRNIILIFWLLSFVEEHRAVIANDEKGVVGRLVAALSMDEHELYIRAKLLSMFSLWSQVENICQLLYQRDIASSVLKYLVVSDLDCNRFAAVIVHHLSNLKDHVRSKLATEGTTEIVVSLLSQCVEKPVAFDPFAYHLAGILANLTVQDEVKSVVINVHGISTVLDFVRWKMDERIYDATQGGDALDIGAKILANLSFDEASKDELIHLGCLELVLQVLARGYASLAGIENYVLCLGNLSTVDQSIPRLENTSAIPILFGLLETYQASSPWITKCVIWAISNMALASSTSRQQIYAYPKGLDVVLSLLVPDAGKQTDTIVECAMSCVSSLVQEEEIAHALGVSSKIGNILRFLEPNVRQSLQRKAVKTIGCLAAHGHAIYIDDLSKTHTNLLSIATDSNLKSIAPSAIHALRRISHLRNESPQVLCANVHGIDTLLKLIQSDVISTVVDALHLIHHIATVTAPIMSNSEYFASKRTCTQATELLSSPNVEVQEGVVRLTAYLLSQTQFCTNSTNLQAENWQLVLARLCRWWELQPNLLSHEATPVLLAGLDKIMESSQLVRSLNDAIFTLSSLRCLCDLLPTLLTQEGEPGDQTLHCVRSLYHLAADSSHYKSVLNHVEFPSQLLHLLVALSNEVALIVLTVLRGIHLYCSVAPTVCGVFTVLPATKRLLKLLFHFQSDIVKCALSILGLLLANPDAPVIIRESKGIESMSSRLEIESDPDNRVQLLNSLLIMWEDSPLVCTQVSECNLIQIVLSKTLSLHPNESLDLLQAISTSVYFYSTFFNHAALLLDLLHQRTSLTGRSTTLILLIICNTCLCNPSIDRPKVIMEGQEVLTFINDWVDMNLLGALLPLSQWIDAPVQLHNRSPLVSPEGTSHIELVLRLLATAMSSDPHLRLVFRDGVDLPDLLSLLRPQDPLLPVGVLKSAASVLAPISFEKDIQIMIVVEDGVNFMSKLLMHKDLSHCDELIQTLVLCIRNLSHDLEVQAILAAQGTIPYFVQLINSLASFEDITTTSGLHVLAVEIVHSLSKTLEWVDVMVTHKCHEAILALVAHGVDYWNDVDVLSLGFATVANLCRTSTPAILHESNTELHLAHVALAHYLPVYATLPERFTSQFSAILSGLSYYLAHSNPARNRLANFERFLTALAKWFVADDVVVEFSDEATVTSLFATLFDVPEGRDVITRHGGPIFLSRVACVCNDVLATSSTHSDCLRILAHCLGPDIDPVEQSSWEYNFVGELIMSKPFEMAISNPSTRMSSLTVLNGFLRYAELGRRAERSSYFLFIIPLSVLQLVVEELGCESIHDEALARSILLRAISSDFTRRSIIESTVFDCLVKLAETKQQLFDHKDTQTIIRNLLDEAVNCYTPRDFAILPIFVSIFMAKESLQISTLTLLGHLALDSPEWCNRVLTQVQGNSFCMSVLSKNVEGIHARTCSLASAHVASALTPNDMLRVYLFSVTLQHLEWTDVAGAICFVGDILRWYHTHHDLVARFTDIYPVLLYCTSCMLKTTTSTMQGQHLGDEWQVDILRDILGILAIASEQPIQVSCLTTLVALNKLWNTDSRLLKLLESTPQKSILLERIANLVDVSTTAALEMLTLIVTTSDLVEDLKAMGVKEHLEQIEIHSQHEKAMTTAVLNLLGYSVDLSEAFVGDLMKFCDVTDDKDLRAALMAKMLATLEMGVVTDDVILQVVIPRLVHEAARDLAYVNEIIQCLQKVSGFPAFVACTSAPSILLRLYVDDFNAFSPQNQDITMDLLMLLCKNRTSPIAFAFFDKTWNALSNLFALAASLYVCNVHATSRILTFAWLVTAPDADMMLLLASQASILTPLCRVLCDPPPPMEKKLESIGKPSQVTHVLIVRFLHAISIQPLGPAEMVECSPIFEALVACLSSYPIDPVQKRRDGQFSYLKDLQQIALQYANHVQSSTFALDTGLKNLVQAVEALSPNHALVPILCGFLADLTQQKPIVTAFYRLQCLDNFVHMFGRLQSADAPTERHIHLLACLAHTSRAGLESEVITRLASDANYTSTLLQCLNQCTRQAQEHAAYLLSTLILYRPELGGSPGFVSLLVESLEAVDLVVVRRVLVCLSCVLQVEGTQETLLRHATVPVLAQVLHKADAEATEHALRVLAVLCSKHAAICRRVVAANLLGVMTSMLRNAQIHEHNSLHAAWILSCVTKDKDLALRLQGSEPSFALECIKYIDKYSPPTASKILRMALNSWSVCSTELPVVGLVHKLMAFAPVSENRSVRKNGCRVLALLFVLPDLDDDSVGDDVVDRLVHYFFDMLRSGEDKLIVASLQALENGLRVESTTDRSIRAFVANSSDGLASVLHLLAAEAYHPSLNQLLLVVKFLNGLVEDDVSTDITSRLENMAVSPLLKLFEQDPLAQFNPQTIKEVLGLLAALTRRNTTLALSPRIINSIKRVIELLNHDEDTTFQSEALHVLVNFASVADLRQSIVLHGGLLVLVGALEHDLGDSQLQLILLGVALLSGDDLAKQTVDFSALVPKLLNLVSSHNTNIQSLAVWIVSNVCVVDSVRQAINAKNGATVLQSLLYQVNNTSSSTERPLSSSKRIREMAPKAIKELGFTPHCS